VDGRLEDGNALGRGRGRSCRARPAQDEERDRHLWRPPRPSAGVYRPRTEGAPAPAAADDLERAGVVAGRRGDRRRAAVRSGRRARPSTGSSSPKRPLPNGFRVRRGRASASSGGDHLRRPRARTPARRGFFVSTRTAANPRESEVVRRFQEVVRADPTAEVAVDHEDDRPPRGGRDGGALTRRGEEASPFGERRHEGNAVRAKEGPVEGRIAGPLACIGEARKRARDGQGLRSASETTIAARTHGAPPGCEEVEDDSAAPARTTCERTLVHHATGREYPAPTPLPVKRAHATFPGPSHPFFRIVLAQGRDLMSVFDRPTDRRDGLMTDLYQVTMAPPPTSRSGPHPTRRPSSCSRAALEAKPAGFYLACGLELAPRLPRRASAFSGAASSTGSGRCPVLEDLRRASSKAGSALSGVPPPIFNGG